MRIHMRLSWSLSFCPPTFVDKEIIYEPPCRSYVRQRSTNPCPTHDDDRDALKHCLRRSLSNQLGREKPVPVPHLFSVEWFRVIATIKGRGTGRKGGSVRWLKWCTRGSLYVYFAWSSFLCSPTLTSFFVSTSFLLMPTYSPANSVYILVHCVDRPSTAYNIILNLGWTNTKY